MHAVKSAFIMLTLYFHMFKSFYYKSWIGNYKNIWTFITGFFLFFLLMLVCFSGYLIPWGQMSFWGIKVITNLLNVIPVIGIKIIQLILGDLEITSLFVQRVITIHFVGGLLLLPLIFIHIWIVHKIKSTDYFVGFKKNSLNFLEFFPVSIWKDFLSFHLLLIVFFIFVFYSKEFLFNFLNNVEVTKNSTPNLIVPEWFFLPFYGCLKILDNKLLGLLLLLLFLITLLIIVIYR